eukprot:TRINITY_DN8065_c0_g2_i1.p1 TRINITY_DN8065_c0_g2~~TRINITY_DN8065_c0_g2_i1.p1  ORF type:complete len:244 (-),score=115.70 TRINITY_DN8065_c0_g2_i1:54-731(-)
MERLQRSLQKKKTTQPTSTPKWKQQQNNPPPPLKKEEPKKIVPPPVNSSSNVQQQEESKNENIIVESSPFLKSNPQEDLYDTKKVERENKDDVDIEEREMQRLLGSFQKKKISVTNNAPKKWAYQDQQNIPPQQEPVNNTEPNEQSKDKESSPFLQSKFEGDLYLTKKKEREEEERKQRELESQKEDPSTNDFGLNKNGEINKTKVSNVISALDDLDSMFDEVLN